MLRKLDALTWVREGGEQTAASVLDGDGICVLIASDVKPEFASRLVKGWKPGSNVIFVMLADEDPGELNRYPLGTAADAPIVSAALSINDEAGQRVFLSGDIAASERAVPIFARMSLDCVFCGPRAGDAQLISLIQHAVCAVSRMLVIEAAGMGLRAGLPVDRVAFVIHRSSGRSRQAELFFDGLIRSDGDAAGKSAPAKRMLDGLLELAMPMNLPLPLISAAASLLSLPPSNDIGNDRGTGDSLATYERLVGLRKDMAVIGKTDQEARSDASTSPVIGYIGLGAMGSALAMQALQVAQELHVYDPDPVKVERLTREGARGASDVASLAAVCDLIFLCVPSGKEVEQILFGPTGVYSSVKRGTIVIDQTTCSPAETVRFGERLAVAGATMIDAPVTAGPEAARNGGIVTMCGGDRMAFCRARPVLEAMGGQVVYFGGLGSGQAAKLVKNALGAGNRLIAYEILSIAAACGVQISTLRAALTTGASASGALDRILRSIETGAPTADARLRTVVKDQQLIARMGRATDAPLPLVNIVRTLLEAGLRILGPEAQVDELGRLYGIGSFKESSAHEKA